jgi:hypothetical protein
MSEEAKKVEGEVLDAASEIVGTGRRTLPLGPLSCVLIFDPNRLSVIAPPLGDDPNAEVPPNIALALTCADMMADAEFIKLMFEMWEKKHGHDDPGGEGQARH